MDKNMADRLIELREKNHLSQSAVANRLGVTPALISAYEKTERNPSLERLIALADIYHTSTDYILGRPRPIPTLQIIEVKDLTDARSVFCVTCRSHEAHGRYPVVVSLFLLSLLSVPPLLLCLLFLSLLSV